MTGYESSFDASKYEKATVTLALYSDAECTTPITDLSGETGSTKICMNSTTTEIANPNDSSVTIYNWGYGDGFITKYVNEGQGFSINAQGEIQINYDLKTFKNGTPGVDIPDCISGQIVNAQIIKGIIVKSVKFE